MERPSVIHKVAATQGQRPNWTAYEEERSRFSWAQARQALQGLPGGGLNMGFEAVDRHAAGVLRYHLALRFVSRHAPALELSYAELARQTNRFANVLQSLGVGKGDSLFLLAGRIPELYVALLGGLKNGSVVKVVWGVTHTAKPAFDMGVEKDLKEYFDRYQTMQLDNFKISDDEISDDGHGRVVVHQSNKG